MNDKEIMEAAKNAAVNAAIEAAVSKIDDCVTTGAYRATVDQKLNEVVGRFEKEAQRYMVIGDAILVLLLGSWVAWQLAVAAQKQAALSERNAAASQRLSNLRITIDQFERETKPKIPELKSEIEKTEASTASLQEIVNSATNGANQKIGAINEQISALQRAIRDLNSKSLEQKEQTKQ
jgi:HAMP domain-containing protein